MGQCFALDGLNHLSDKKEHANIPEAYFQSAADLSLIWPDKKSGCLIWTSILNDSELPTPSIKELSEKIENMSTHWKWHAWILLAAPDTEDFIPKLDSSFKNISIFQVPQKMTENWAALQEQFNYSLNRIDE
jgi:hypothetical protein